MRIEHWILALLVLSTLSCVSAGTKDTLAVEPEVLQSLTRYEKAYVLGPGDEINVSVYRNPELSRVSIVRSDGFISIPLLDDVKAAGYTVPELDLRLTERLSTRLVNPEVTVAVTNPREAMVYVFGEVGVATAVPFRQARTAAQAIAMAAGFNVSANRSHVAIIRLDEEGRLRAYVAEDLSGQPGFYMALQNMHLQPDDLIVVPESTRSQFVRFIQDFLNTPLSGINQALGPYFQFKLISVID